jgi:hypothetical protein
MQMMVKGPALPLKFAGCSPDELLDSGDWAWHDMNTAQKAPEGALAVWSFNGKSERWATGQSFLLEAEGLAPCEIRIEEPLRSISAVTFLSSDNALNPDTVLIHLENRSSNTLLIRGARFWLPREATSWQVLWPEPVVSLSGSIPPDDKGFVRVKRPGLPLTYTALELITDQGTMWAHLRIKPETFDISGGWVGGHVIHPEFLQLLTHLHVNTGHFGEVAGYTDNPELYQQWPLKLFNRLTPISKYDTEEWLPKIHAVEFLGEPQYGGGTPVPPQKVFDELLPYRASRLPTTVTHSEERIWRWYAGLSDYPHYDAYRVVAPSADSWRLYDRWGGRTIRWGAPLETIGEMCRSLRELNRPMPCAYWSQGPHHGWGGGFDGRRRRSPTPEELRAQAMHALSTRITSLYWFNLSLKSLMKYPDTWEPMTRIGREIRMLEPFFLEGDAYRFERKMSDQGSPDWDLASIGAPDAAVLFALDLAYAPDPQENVFRFPPPREVQFHFRLPPWLRDPKDVFRVDADGLHEVEWQPENLGVTIRDRQSADAIYIATPLPQIRQSISQRLQKALDREADNPINRQALTALYEQP